MCCTFVPEASLVPCDDVSGNTDLDHSKSAISSGKKERTNDEAASTSSMSTSVHDQVSFIHTAIRRLCMLLLYAMNKKNFERGSFVF